MPVSVPPVSVSLPESVVVEEEVSELVPVAVPSPSSEGLSFC
jgi:hypothetical protein